MNAFHKIDLHLHTTVSDGTDSPEELLEKVREAGLDLFAVTDHDAVKGCGILRGILKPGDPYFLSGAEFSCRDEKGRYHILGYGFDPDAEPVRQLVEQGHRYRMNKVRARLEFIRDEFGFTFPKEEIRRLLSLDNPGKPHIGNLMVRYGYAKTKEDAIRNFLDRLHLKSDYVRPEEAIRGILGGGGIPVLAHPSYGSGNQLIIGTELEERIRRLTGYGLQGVEAYYSGFTGKLTRELLGLAEAFGLYVTAGSDYHGKNKMIEIGDTGLEDLSEAPEGLLRFVRDVTSGERKTDAEI